MTRYDEVIGAIKQRVAKTAPDATVILFGSRARGDARPDSDWDILILVDRENIDYEYSKKVSYPVFDLAWEIDAEVSPKLYTKEEWKQRSFTPFYKNVETDGIVLMGEWKDRKQRSRQLVNENV